MWKQRRFVAAGQPALARYGVCESGLAVPHAFAEVPGTVLRSAYRGDRTRGGDGLKILSGFTRMSGLMLMSFDAAGAGRAGAGALFGITLFSADTEAEAGQGLSTLFKASTIFSAHMTLYAAPLLGGVCRAAERPRINRFCLPPQAPPRSSKLAIL
ncbi:hypothetical protein B0H16DRAFT_43827 [Mycena metata]|uniref:Uncharacterized protein n=1 Tax=Mycena metata TaxID=1033252 RepID=A0AAD7NUN0_9AGAR|nr:hypothetical protein B0H16DRAFT_43827 [Mycena metata]